MEMKKTLEVKKIFFEQDLVIPNWMINDIKYGMILFIIGCVIYFSIGSNFLTNPDSSVFLVYKYGQSESDFGRIGLKYIEDVFGKIVCAPFSVVGTVGMYSIIIIMITHILGVEKNLGVVFLMGLFILLSPVTSSTITYHCFSMPYTLGYFLVVLSVCMLGTDISRFWRIGVSGFFFALSLTLYQAYLPVAIVLVAIKMILMIIREQRIKDVLLLGAESAFSVLLGVMLYIIGLNVMKVQLTSNRSFDSIGKIGIRNIPGLITRAYYNFFQFFFGNELLNNTFLHRNVWNAVTMAGIIGLFVYLCILKRIYMDRAKLFMYIFIIIVLPMLFEFISIMAPDVSPTSSTGIIRVPTMPLFYCLYVVLLKEGCKNCIYRGIDSYVKNIIMMAGVVLNILLLICHITFTAMFINQMWLNLNQMQTLCESIVEDVWEEYGYTEGDKLLITGSKDDGNFKNDWHGYKEQLRGTLAYYGYSWNGWIQNWCYASFMEYYLGVRYEYGDIESYDNMIGSQQWKGMPIYPNKGSIKKIDDLIVIKLSE